MRTEGNKTVRENFANLFGGHKALSNLIPLDLKLDFEAEKTVLRHLEVDHMCVPSGTTLDFRFSADRIYAGLHRSLSKGLFLSLLMAVVGQAATASFSSSTDGPSARQKYVFRFSLVSGAHLLNPHCH
jgi:hypothetical protein